MGLYSLLQLFSRNKIILKNGKKTDSFLNKLKSIFLIFNLIIKRKKKI